MPAIDEGRNGISMEGVSTTRRRGKQYSQGNKVREECPLQRRNWEGCEVPLLGRARGA